MDRTTYAQPDVVSLIEERFVPVRVDADRRPDINERCNLGGWPTTLFLTSRGDTLFGDTFLDPPRMMATLNDVANAYRDRAGEIDARAALTRSVRLQPDRGLTRSVRLQPDPNQLQPDGDAVKHFRSLLVDRFDPIHGGFGTAPKLPHPHAVLFALSLAADGDSKLGGMAALTLRRMRALWDPVAGGFFRYADAPDWSRPGSGKTLEDNAALLHVHVEAALQLRDAEWLEQTAAIVRWVREAMAEGGHGGFFNARSVHQPDTTMYVDKNGMMIGAFIRAAALFDDVWLRDYALNALEEVIVPAYTPGGGVAHVTGASGSHGIRGLLTDQIHAVSALIWAHAATGQLPYSMLAAEVLQFAIRTMWDEAAGGFRDRVEPHDPFWPFELNCQAACVLDRLAVLTGDAAYQDRARTILRTFSAQYRDLDLFGAPYALALREIFDRRPPAGLELCPVDWQLG